MDKCAFDSSIVAYNKRKKYYFDIFLTKMLLFMKIMLFLRDINRTWKLLI